MSSHAWCSVLPPDLPDQLPSLTPAPPKKSRFKASRVTFEDEDAEERLDRHDTHISAVLSRIVVSAYFYHQMEGRLRTKHFPQSDLSMTSLHFQILSLKLLSRLHVWRHHVYFDVILSLFVFVFFHNFTNRSVTFFCIKERDTSSAPISLPALTDMAFPKVLHRSETGCQVKQLQCPSFVNDGMSLEKKNNKEINHGAISQPSTLCQIHLFNSTQKLGGGETAWNHNCSNEIS